MKPFILSFAMLSMVCATATSELAFARGGSAGHSGDQCGCSEYPYVFHNCRRCS